MLVGNSWKSVETRTRYAVLLFVCRRAVFVEGADAEGVKGVGLQAGQVMWAKEKVVNIQGWTRGAGQSVSSHLRALHPRGPSPPG